MGSTNAEQVAFDIQAKEQLENQLLRRLKVYNNKIAKEYRKSIIQSGGVSFIDLESFESELEIILFRHYQRVGFVFVNRINDLVEEEVEKLDKLEKKTIEFKAKKTRIPVPVVISRSYRVRASQQVRKITDTSKKQAREALTAINKKSNESATSLTELEIASQSGTIFQSFLNGRQNGIARFNTNGPAEVAKLTQIQILRGEEPSLSGGNQSTGTKQWNNQADSVVRDGINSSFNHLFAIQRVNIAKPFIVSGQRLRFPGDISLGATAGNVNNCRCSASYDIRDTARIVKRRREGKPPQLSLRQFSDIPILDKIANQDAARKAKIFKKREQQERELERLERERLARAN